VVHAALRDKVRGAALHGRAHSVESRAAETREVRPHAAELASVAEDLAGELVLVGEAVVAAAGTDAANTI
jgi:hypothetical protein